jgi:hypothetical protein
MTRKDVLSYMRIAGYHSDTAAYTRLYVENRISRAIAQEAWLSGVNAEKSGMKCTCLDCTTKGLS